MELQPEPTPRGERIARNESRYREINDMLHDGLHALSGEGGDRERFFCECGSAECSASLQLPAGFYAAVRADSRRFVILPGHEFADVEDVVETHPGWSVVQKRAGTAPVAEELDPRR